MRAVVVTEPGEPEVLAVQEVPDPVAGPGEVIVRVAAAALNRADVLQRQGNYPPPPGAPPYLGMECSGTVEALGDSVAGWSVGDQVCALLAGGGYAELVPVPVGQLMPIPAGIGLVDAAALPEVGLHGVVHGVLGRPAGAGRVAARARRLERHRDDGDPDRAPARRRGC